MAHGINPLFNRPCEARAVLQIPLLLNDRLTDPFPLNIHNTKNPKPLEVGTWNLTQCSQPVI